MTPLHYLSVARFDGLEAGSFLQTQLSADIAALSPGDSTFACYCSPRGQVLGLLLVCREDDHFLVAADSGLLPGILTRLKMFVLRAKVEFSELPEWRICGDTGDEEQSTRDVYQPAGSSLRYRFVQKATRDDEGESGFRAQEIVHRVVWLGEETREKFIPQMLGFEQLGAVSFSKGCYPGQEIVARARYLGKVKRGPLILKLDTNLVISAAQHAELRRGDDWLKGTVIDSVITEDGGTLLFMVAPAEPAIETTELRIENQAYRCATI